MTDSYNVGYSVDALDDLREIYSYLSLFRKKEKNMFLLTSLQSR